MSNSKHLLSEINFKTLRNISNIIRGAVVSLPSNISRQRLSCFLGSGVPHSELILTSSCHAQHDKNHHHCFERLPCYLTNHQSDSAWHRSTSWKIFPETLLRLISVWKKVHDLRLCADFHVNVSILGEIQHMYCRLIMRDKPAAFLSSSNQSSLQINSFKSSTTWRWIVF